jgi:hypothetical protein
MRRASHPLVANEQVARKPPAPGPPPPPAAAAARTVARAQQHAEGAAHPISRAGDWKRGGEGKRSGNGGEASGRPRRRHPQRSRAREPTPQPPHPPPTFPPAPPPHPPRSRAPRRAGLEPGPSGRNQTQLRTSVRSGRGPGQCGRKRGVLSESSYSTCAGCTRVGPWRALGWGRAPATMGGVGRVACGSTGLADARVRAWTGMDGHLAQHAGTPARLHAAASIP